MNIARTALNAAKAAALGVAAVKASEYATEGLRRVKRGANAAVGGALKSLEESAEKRRAK